MKRTWIRGVVLEPCVGRGDIANALSRDQRIANVTTNDVDSGRPAHTHFDATDPAYWNSLPDLDWVVTNPPFNVAHVMLPLAYQKASNVAMLLRITYLEPCEGRGSWLAAHPPSKLIVLPRISFTGDGKTDSATCAWMVWDSDYSQSIEIVQPREDEGALPLELGA